MKKRTESDKVLEDKAFKIASNPENDGYQRGLALMIYKVFFNKKSTSSGIKCQINNMQMKFIKELLENLKEEKLILHLKRIFGVLIC